jgi:hypothetical protein
MNTQTPEIRDQKSEIRLRDKREVSTGSRTPEGAPASSGQHSASCRLNPIHFPPAPPLRTAVTTLSDADHSRIARRHGGCPITYITSDGKARAAIRLPDGEILIDYRSELTFAVACLAEYLRIPPSARH